MKISVCLAHQGSLRYLNLSHNFIEDEGTRRLSEALQKNCFLEFLNLSSNNIRNEIGKCFIETTI
jgi:Leucine-rich repeat (LRR) protein